MAKKQEGMNEIFRKIEPINQEIKDPVMPIGIGLKTSEWARIEEIAQDLYTTRHALAMWALRDFIRRYLEGEIETRTETKKTLPGL
jgi:hypothetical protein